MTEDRQIISKTISEIYHIKPAPGKKLQDIKTGAVYKSGLRLATNEKPEDYREID